MRRSGCDGCKEVSSRSAFTGLVGRPPRSVMGPESLAARQRLPPSVRPRGASAFQSCLAGAVCRPESFSGRVAPPASPRLVLRGLWRSGSIGVFSCRHPSYRRRLPRPIRRDSAGRCRVLNAAVYSVERPLTSMRTSWQLPLEVAGCTLKALSESTASPLTVTRWRVLMGLKAEWWACPVCRRNPFGVNESVGSPTRVWICSSRLPLRSTSAAGACRIRTMQRSSSHWLKESVATWP